MLSRRGRIPRLSSQDPPARLPLVLLEGTLVWTVRDLLESGGLTDISMVVHRLLLQVLLGVRQLQGGQALREAQSSLTTTADFLM